MHRLRCLRMQRAGIGLFAAPSGEEVGEEAAFWNLPWGSVPQTRGGGKQKNKQKKHPTVALSSKGLGGRGAGKEAPRLPGKGRGRLQS